MFLVQIQVEALDRNRLLSDVTRVLSDAPRQHPVGERAATRVTGWRCPGSPSRWATPDTSTTCSRAVRKIDGVFDVYRITGGKAAKPEPV